MTRFEAQGPGQRRRLSFWTLRILVLTALCAQVRAQNGRPTIAQYIQQKAANAVYIAGNATENERNCGALVNCPSLPSALACTDVPVSDLQCTGTAPNDNQAQACGVSSCSSLFLSYNYSSIRLPGLSIQQSGSSPGLISALAQDLINRDVCVHQPLDAVFRSIVPANVTFLDWAYFATARGVMREYPFKVGAQAPADTRSVVSSANSIQCADGYDPKRRNWFNGAASQSKTLIVLLDVSATSAAVGNFPLGSNNLTPLALMKSATSRLLDTLRAGDTIGVFAFQGSVVTQLDYIQVKTYDTPRTSEPAVVTLNATIGGLSASGDTRARSDLVRALSQAVALFQTTPAGDPPVACEKAVIVMTEGASLAPFDPAAVANITQGVGASLFLFSVGDVGLTGNDALLRNASCTANGVWGRLNNYQDPLISLYPYFNYLAFRSPYKNGTSTYRTKPYQDFTISASVVTHSKPVFDPAGNFVGVAGDDFPTDFGFALTYGIDPVNQALQNFSESCSGVQPTFCDLQRIRSAFASDPFTCPSPSQSACPASPVVCPANALPSTSVVLKPPGNVSDVTSLTCCGTCRSSASTPFIAPIAAPPFRAQPPAPVSSPLPAPPPGSTTPETESHKTRNIVIAVVVVAIICALAAGAVFLFCCIRRRAPEVPNEPPEPPKAPDEPGSIFMAPPAGRSRTRDEDA